MSVGGRPAHTEDAKSPRRFRFRKRLFVEPMKFVFGGGKYADTLVVRSRLKKWDLARESNKWILYVVQRLESDEFKREFEDRKEKGGNEYRKE